MPSDTEILDWLEAHGISVRIAQNERQSFCVPASREAIAREMIAGNVEVKNEAQMPEVRPQL